LLAFLAEDADRRVVDSSDRKPVTATRSLFAWYPYTAPYAGKASLA